MTQIIRLRKATGVQLQQAAHHAQLIDMPNQVYGLANAYYASVPSPMQEAILRKALQAAGINYLKVEEQVTAAGAADRFDRVLQEGLKQMVKATKAGFDGDTQSEVRVAGHILYATVHSDEGQDPVRVARNMVKGKGFTQTNGKTWNKVVRLKRKSFVAAIEIVGSGVQLSVFKGA